jgi:flagellin
MFAMDAAITAVNSQRASLGASMSRLEYAADNLQNVAQNTASARSRVLDADYASETTELARTQIIQQASTAMLAQANQSQQAVLSLLR